MKKTNRFFRSFFLSLTVLCCVSLGTMAAARAYENTVRVRTGEIKKAVEITAGKIRVFDWEIEWGQKDGAKN